MIKKHDSKQCKEDSTLFIYIDRLKGKITNNYNLFESYRGEPATFSQQWISLLTMWYVLGGRGVLMTLFDQGGVTCCWDTTAIYQT